MRTFKLAFVLIIASTAAFAALHFPALTGRVVDEAHVLSHNTTQSIEQMLAEYENGTSNQVVVVTIPSLQGTTIEDYGYQLGRSWQIGQKDKNNGVLLIVAPNERKVRIEVGYGLEPVLTDAAASGIVQGIILPQFRAGHMEQGITAGTQAILSVLGGKAAPHANVDNNMSQTEAVIILVFALLFIFLRIFEIRHPLVGGLLLLSSPSRFGSSGLSGSSWGGGGGFGGFSGGGGSFGGGGASGGW